LFEKLLNKKKISYRPISLEFCGKNKKEIFFKNQVTPAFHTPKWTKSMQVAHMTACAVVQDF